MAKRSKHTHKKGTNIITAVALGALASFAYLNHDSKLPSLSCNNSFNNSKEVSSGKNLVEFVMEISNRINPPVYENYTQIDYNNPKLRQRINEGKFDSGFLSSLENMCQRLDMHCMAMVSVMDHETARTFRPDIQNPYSNATGLIQFMPSTARGLGTSIGDLKYMSQIDQLEFVEKYFARKKKAQYRFPEDIALAVFYPVAVGNPNYVISVKDEIRPKIYQQNKGGDVNKDGKIHAWEYSKRALDRGFFNYIPTLRR